MTFCREFSTPPTVGADYRAARKGCISRVIRAVGTAKVMWGRISETAIFAQPESLRPQVAQPSFSIFNSQFSILRRPRPRITNHEPRIARLDHSRLEAVMLKC